MFSRRTPPSVLQQMQALFWPRKGFSRPWRYLGIRLLRAKGSVHHIAAGVAAGVLGGLNPIYGIQMLTAGVAAVLLRGNVWVAMLASWVANPITYPFFWLAEWWVGRALLEGQWPKDLWPDFADLFTDANWADIWHLLKPMLVGYPVVALVVSALFYVVSCRVVRYYRTHHPQFLPYSERHP